MAEKKCPACAEKIKREALKCRFCGHEFDAQAVAEEQRKSSNGKLIAGLAVLGIIGAIALSNPENKSDAVANSMESTASATTPMAKPNEALDKAAAELHALADAVIEKEGKWLYHRRRDEMRGGEIISAQIISDNKVNLDFPYHGEQPMRMTFRQHPAYGTDVYFSVDRGQMLCRPFDDCKGMINIDGKAERLSLTEPNDGDTTMLFASYGPAMFKKIKSAKKVIVEIPFYQNGNQQFTFSTHGLQWPPPK